jgi:hypothetical protein
MFRHSGLAFLLMATSALASAQDPPLIDDTPDAACGVLKSHMAKLMRLPGGKVPRSWFCDTTSTTNDLFYIMGLRSDPSVDGKASPTVPLIGWFAVARRSTVVLGYDINEDRVVPIPEAYRGH